MLTKEEEESIIFDIRFGDIPIVYLIKEQFTQRICNELFTKVIGSDTRKLVSVPGSNKSLRKMFLILPKEFITKEMSDIAFKKSAYFIRYLPEEFITQEMCNIAFKSNKYLTRFFPKEFITEEICDIAFEKDSNLFSYFPKEFITEEMEKRRK